MLRDSTPAARRPPGEASCGRAAGGRAWAAAAALAAMGWALLVAASPPRFFAWATPLALAWMALSLAGAPPGLRARLHPRGTDVLLGLAVAGVLYAGARAFLWAGCGGVTEALCAPTAAMFERFRTRALGPGLALALAIAPAEEAFWRGLVQARLAPRLGPARAVGTATALAAALALATGEGLLALATVPTYAAWGALVVWRGSLVPALVSHAAWSVLIATVAPPG